jgi:hypothetical protein
MSKSGSVNSARLSIFGVLTLGVTGLFLYSWSQPWWSAYIVALKEYGVSIFPHAMIIGGTLQDYPQWLVGAEMPSWFFPAMWVYLAFCMGAVVFSLFVFQDRIRLGKLKLSLPSAVVGAVGLSYIVFVLVFVIVVAVRAPQFYGASVQGSVFVHMAEHEGNAESYVETGLQLGYWLACAAGALLLVLALLRDKIVGEA